MLDPTVPLNQDLMRSKLAIPTGALQRDSQEATLYKRFKINLQIQVRRKAIAKTLLKSIITYVIFNKHV